VKKLTGKVAIIAGGSRGAGRGIALALGDAGATVYVAARTSRGGPKPSDGAPGTVEDTAEEVTARGGRGIAIRADLSDANQVAALFQRVEEEQGRLDILANSAWAPNCMAFWGKRFWNLSLDVWRETMGTVSVCWLSSVHAIRLMAKARCGLIIHVTDNIGWTSEPSPYRGQVLHDLGHECLNRLVMGMSQETKKLKIAVVGLNPGFMRTERVLMYMTSEARKKQSRFDLSESPEYIGRAVVALAADSKVMDRNGQLLWAPDLAKEYGFTDVDGRLIPRFDPNAPMQAFPC
jgi:NAD(P)-dependent dehydrogenase (short-subunit alcohol dehydrogenase family)